MNTAADKQNSQKISPVLVLVLSILAVSTASIMIKFAQAEADSLVIAFYRMAVASLIYLVVAFTFFRQELFRLQRKTIVLCVLSGFFLALHFATWITSLEFTTVTSSAVLVSTTPLWVALASIVLFHEKLNKLYWVGLFVALIGVVLVSLPALNGQPISSQSHSDVSSLISLGSILALSGALFGTGYILIGRQLRKTVSMPVYAALTYTSSALFLLSMVLITRSPLTGFSPNIYLLMIAIGLLPQVIGHSAYNWALKYIPASVISIALLGEPVGASIQAMLFIGEMPGVNEITGGILILVGIYIASVYGTRTRKKSNAELS